MSRFFSSTSANTKISRNQNDDERKNGRNKTKQKLLFSTENSIRTGTMPITKKHTHTLTTIIGAHSYSGRILVNKIGYPRWTSVHNDEVEIKNISFFSLFGSVLPSSCWMIKSKDFFHAFDTRVNLSLNSGNDFPSFRISYWIATYVKSNVKHCLQLFGVLLFFLLFLYFAINFRFSSPGTVFCCCCLLCLSY